jgi:3-oxoacyl-[acyl-carrier protein] reductase
MANQFDVILTYSSDDQNAKMAAEHLNNSFAAKASVLKADSTDLSSIDTISNYITTHQLRLDALVLNAGITDRASFLDMKLENWTKVFDANVHFPTFLIQKLVPVLNAGSSIVCTGSTMALFPHSVSLVYGVTKSATHALVKNLVKFLSPLNIRINGIAPGFVDTEWQKTKPAEIKASINSKIALGRFCEPNELAEIYWMLIKNEYINGEIVSVDGGYSFK